MDARGIEIGHQRRDEGMVRLVRHGGGFGAVIVAGEAQHAAIPGRARGIAVPEDVAAAVDAGTLAVPDTDHAIVPGAGRQIELLRAPDRGRREIFVHAGLKLDVILFEVLSRGEQLLIVAAQRRTTITTDKARSIEACGAVAADLCHRQPDQRLNAGQEDVSGPLGVFLIETDRTLVNSHSTLFKSDGSSPSALLLASYLNPLGPVYVGFCAGRTPNLDNGDPRQQIAISCREYPRVGSVCVFRPAGHEMAWRDRPHRFCAIML